ncbi:MAG: aspartate aminotransferase family protein [Candidatus Omnitrophica bacterium]|nr:aspartate aminotransferase family protein [Candidatus Omnitrophota bacterium]
MRTADIEKLYEQYVIPVYNRNGICVARGSGSWVWDQEGKRYLDLFPGWGVNILGHCHPLLVKAVQSQAKRLLHVPNTFYHQPQAELARELIALSFKGKAFFSNSGAESVEAAIKLARKFGNPGRWEILTMEGSFHGRTMAALAATGQAKYHRGFEPIPPGFRHVPFNDLEALRRALRPETVAVMVEPIQGEGGVFVGEEGYLRGLRKLCDEEKLLLILDEITTCMGRTGTFFAFEPYGITPDIVLLAKGAAGGLPLGVMIAREGISDLWEKATHATTFGGNPLVTAAGLCTIEIIRKEKLLAHVRREGRVLLEKLAALQKKHPVIREIRGRGFMIGLELETPGAPIVKAALHRGLLINCTQERILRFYPALNVTRAELEQGIKILDQALREAVP